MDKQQLLAQLRSPQASVRNHATQQLWQLWFGAEGPAAEAELLHAETLIEAGELLAADDELTRVIEQHSRFAEAWNRRATLRYMLKRYDESLADCAVVVQLEPEHFGAWHGIGLCHLAGHRYDQAAAAFLRALEIQPFAMANLELLRTCVSKLN